MPESSSECLEVVVLSKMPMMADALAKLIGSFPNVRISNVLTSVEQTKAFLQGASIDVVVVDIDSGLKPISVLELIATDHLKVLVITQTDDTETFGELVSYGASGVVGKTEPSLTLARAIECVAAGELWLDRKTTGKVFHTFARRKDNTADQEYADHLAKLTRKEKEIVKALLENPTSPGKRIASLLNISEHTLRNHLTSIYSKLGVNKRAELFMLVSRTN